MKKLEVQKATIYNFQSDNCEDFYRIECIEGIVTGISKASVVYEDTGDCENGPHLSSSLSNFQELELDRVYFESDLETKVDEIVKHAEAYTLYCMMQDVHYSNF